MATMPTLTDAASAVAAASDSDPLTDIADLRRGRYTPKSLLQECTNDADPEDIPGWVDYVCAVVDAADVAMPASGLLVLYSHDTNFLPRVYETSSRDDAIARFVSDIGYSSLSDAAYSHETSVYEYTKALLTIAVCEERRRRW